MGHCSEILIVDKKSEIMVEAQEFAWRNATYLGTTKPYHVYVGIIQIMNSGYVVKFYCDFTNLLSADCIKVAHTDEELRSVLENLRTGVLYHLFGGLEERLNESMVEYLSEFERLL